MCFAERGVAPLKHKMVVERLCPAHGGRGGVRYKICSLLE